MPRSEDLVLRLVDVRLRIERLQAALSGSIDQFLTEEDRTAIRGALARAQAEKQDLEEQIRKLSPGQANG